MSAHPTAIPPGEDEHSSSPSSQKPVGLLQLDDVYDRIVGSHGLWQVMIVILVCFSTCSVATFSVYANAVPRSRCKMELEVEKSLAERAVSFHEAATLIGPWPEDPNDEGLHQGRQGCRRYKRSGRGTNLQKLPGNSSTEACPHGHVFDPWEHQYPSSIVAEWDLVCDGAWKVPFSTSMYMVGMMIVSQGVKLV
ncbi:unnamed protein product [Dibothriocephalus latus]|uniref:Uncharacterized protein n=1 Tax=Dibothriocephalus latus TaxID=60516 RepID=A0A3P6Q1L7_DIBLA|nr:unnamed protein product [Dibothriocephalus latus]